MPTQKNYIHGRYTSTSDTFFETSNPANNKVICKVHQANSNDVNEAILSAKEGFLTWSTMPAIKRARILQKAVKILHDKNDELAKLEVLDTGKPIQEAICVDIQSGADCLEFFAGLAPTIAGRHIELPSAFGYTRREPIGICVGIGAWNYPIQIACWKSAPALACGNVMIFKPSELTPLTALKLAEIYTEAGLPNGVFNVIQGDASVGQLLTKHPDTHKISLTGEVNTGKEVIANAAPAFKHITMELGGKSPLIIFEDANLDNAVSASMVANFYTQGEICSNGTRVFVHEKIKDAFLEKLLQKTKNIIIGDPLDPKTQMGALISKQHLQRVLTYVEHGVKEGANLLYGGKQVVDGDLSQGNFMMPTIFTNCKDNMKIVQEEIFGPVMSVLIFKNQDDVIQRANNTSFGLAAGIFTQDINRAHNVIAQLQAGTCWINNYNITPIELPFGGYKNSGIIYPLKKTVLKCEKAYS